MVELTRVGALSLAKLLGTVMALAGLVAGISYSFGGLIYDIATTGSVNKGTALAFFALLGMPAIFAAAGFLTGFLSALAYNMAARWCGGIVMELD